MREKIVYAGDDDRLLLTEDGRVVRERKWGEDWLREAPLHPVVQRVIKAQLEELERQGQPAMAGVAPPSPPVPRAEDTTMEDVTIHELMQRGRNAIVLTDPDLNIVFAWNGSDCFLAFQEVGRSRFTLVDNWSTDARPATLSEAQDRCRTRLDVIRREHAAADPAPETADAFPSIFVYCGLAWLSNRLPADLASLDLKEGAPNPEGGIIAKTRSEDPTAKVFYLDVMDPLDCVPLPGSSHPSPFEAKLSGATTVVFSGLRSCRPDVIAPAFKALSRCARGAVVLALP